MNLTRWIGGLTGDPKLCEVVMPGSHDAGVYGDKDVAVVNHAVGDPTFTTSTTLKKTLIPTTHTRLCMATWAKCQSTNLAGQALYGSRFFDLRIYVKQRTFWGKKDLKAGHFTFFEGTKHIEPSMGGYGGSLISLINDAVNFVHTHTSEFLILRFSHVKNHKLVRDGIEAQLNAMKAFKYKRVYDGGNANLGDTKVSDLAGKVIMVFDTQFDPVRTGSYAYWMVPWNKLGPNSPTGTQVHGLRTCGTFSKSDTIAVVKAGQIAAIDTHITHLGSTDPRHLSFVYWQQTGEVPGKLNVKETTTKTKKSAHSELGDFVTVLCRAWGAAGGDRQKPPANVISHDFVKPDTCERIIKMNPDYWDASVTNAMDEG